jgi:hypothetical protein
MKTKHIILFAFMFVCGCVVTFCANNNTKSTPMEFLHENSLEPPKVEMPEEKEEESFEYDKAEIRTIYVAYLSDTGKPIIEQQKTCKGCHWRCEQ